jgi:hypothetical protein
MKDGDDDLVVLLLQTPASVILCSMRCTYSHGYCSRQTRMHANTV